VVETIIKKSSLKNKKSMRYQPEFLLECLVLRIQSRTAYNHLRDNNILPLPGASTIRRLLSCFSCTFGFNDFALKAIKERLLGEPIVNRYGTLSFDEMAITEDITFDGQSLRFEGFVDFGEDVSIEEHTTQLADHALLFCFRPFMSNWIQPIGCFATRGAASGKILQQLIIQATTALHGHEAIVKALVFDGAQTNKQAMMLLGVHGKLDETAQNFFIHPLIDEEKIFVFVDPPHLIKCIRNHIVNKGKVQVIILFNNETKFTKFTNFNLLFIFSSAASLC
jgi:hypothetical protein